MNVGCDWYGSLQCLYDTAIVEYCDKLLNVTLLQFPNSVTISDYHCYVNPSGGKEMKPWRSLGPPASAK